MIEHYLQRINLSKKEPSLLFLNELIRAHRLYIPIENLWAHYGTSLPFEIKTLFDKIILSNRGGYQLQLNSLFEQLLTALGFETRLVSAAPHTGDQWGKAMDLMFIMINLEEKQHLVDVGLPSGPYTALEISPAQMKLDNHRYFKFDQNPDAEFVLYSSTDFTRWVPMLKMDLRQRRFIEFIERDKYFAVTKKYPFLPGKFCARALENGQMILTEGEFLIRDKAEVFKYPVNLDEDFISKLEQHFEFNPVEN